MVVRAPIFAKIGKEIIEILVQSSDHNEPSPMHNIASPVAPIRLGARKEASSDRLRAGKSPPAGTLVCNYDSRVKPKWGSDKLPDHTKKEIHNGNTIRPNPRVYCSKAREKRI